jgi:hypothetical protein
MSSPALLGIGDFSRATQLSVKMLRHYHQIGLLEPVDVDRATGYRATAPTRTQQHRSFAVFGR